TKRAAPQVPLRAILSARRFITRGQHRVGNFADVYEVFACQSIAVCSTDCASAFLIGRPTGRYRIPGLCNRSATPLWQSEMGSANYLASGWKIAIKVLSRQHDESGRPRSAGSLCASSIPRSADRIFFVERLRSRADESAPATFELGNDGIRVTVGEWAM